MACYLRVGGNMSFLPERYLSKFCKRGEDYWHKDKYVMSHVLRRHVSVANVSFLIIAIGLVLCIYDSRTYFWREVAGSFLYETADSITYGVDSKFNPRIETRSWVIGKYSYLVNGVTYRTGPVRIETANMGSRSSRDIILLFNPSAPSDYAFRRGPSADSLIALSFGSLILIVDYLSKRIPWRRR